MREKVKCHILCAVFSSSDNLLSLSKMPHILVPLQRHSFQEVVEEEEEKGNQDIRWVFSHLSVAPLLKACFHGFGLFLPSPLRKTTFFLFVCFFFFFFLGPHSQHMKIPKLGVELQVHLQAYATATATLDLSRIYDLPTVHSNVRSLAH